jgi:hypothetical protein
MARARGSVRRAGAASTRGPQVAGAIPSPGVTRARHPGGGSATWRGPARRLGHDPLRAAGTGASARFLAVVRRGSAQRLGSGPARRRGRGQPWPPGIGVASLGPSGPWRPLAVRLPGACASSGSADASPDCLGVALYGERPPAWAGTRPARSGARPPRRRRHDLSRGGLDGADTFWRAGAQPATGDPTWDHDQAPWPARPRQHGYVAAQLDIAPRLA